MEYEQHETLRSRDKDKLRAVCIKKGWQKTKQKIREKKTYGN